MLRKTKQEHNVEKRKKRITNIPVHCRAQWQHLDSYSSCRGYFHRTHKSYWTLNALSRIVSPLVSCKEDS